MTIKPGGQCGRRAAFQSRLCLFLHEGEQGEEQEEHEADLGDGGGESGQGTEAEKPCDEGDDDKDNRVVEHGGRRWEFITREISAASFTGERLLALYQGGLNLRIWKGIYYLSFL